MCPFAVPFRELGAGLGFRREKCGSDGEAEKEESAEGRLTVSKMC